MSEISQLGSAGIRFQVHGCFEVGGGFGILRLRTAEHDQQFSAI